MRRRIPAQPQPEQAELNLAPIMNMVMILIPLLLLSVVFTKAGVVDLSTVTVGQNETPPDDQPPEQTAPELVIHVSSDGYRVYDQNGDDRVRALAPADPTCSVDENGPAICARDGSDLVATLDYHALRATMVVMREHEEWAEPIGERDVVVRVAADPEVPFDALIATMDAIRNYPGEEGATLFPNVALLTVAPQG